LAAIGRPLFGFSSPNNFEPASEPAVATLAALRKFLRLSLFIFVEFPRYFLAELF
jgi:hypothetical protein